MKSMTRKQLADLAGVHPRTLARWMHLIEPELQKRGYKAQMRRLPPKVVEYIIDSYGIG